MIARGLYTLFWLLVLPFVFIRIFLRGRKEPGYRAFWQQRFACDLPVKPNAPLLWLHAVSLGETRAAAPLLEHLFKQFPQHHVLLTHATATGRAEGELLVKKYSGRMRQAWLPYDLPFFMKRFLHHFKPDIGIVMETEVWPNLMCCAMEMNVPIVLANARLSEKSAKRYLYWKGLSLPAFKSFNLVLAQTEADAARLRQVGVVQVVVKGNVKFDMRLDELQLQAGRTWRAVRKMPVILCASTREGEEALLLKAWLANPEHQNASLMMVPRHPQRFEEVASLIKSEGFELLRRSNTADWSLNSVDTQGTTVLLGDSLGEMAMYFASADVTIVGGSLLNTGSQNFIEACAAACPVVLGPSTFNFAQAAVDAIAAGAATQPVSAEQALTLPALETAKQLVKQALTLACSPVLAEPLRQAAQHWAQSHEGAALAQASAIQQVMTAAHPPARH